MHQVVEFQVEPMYLCVSTKNFEVFGCDFSVSRDWPWFSQDFHLGMLEQLKITKQAIGCHLCIVEGRTWGMLQGSHGVILIKGRANGSGSFCNGFWDMFLHLVACRKLELCDPKQGEKILVEAKLAFDNSNSLCTASPSRCSTTWMNAQLLMYLRASWYSRLSGVQRFSTPSHRSVSSAAFICTRSHRWALERLASCALATACKDLAKLPVTAKLAAVYERKLIVDTLAYAALLWHMLGYV